jgi:hypothetical protein
VRQRNDNDHPLYVHTDPPQTVEPGDTVDWPDLVVGLTPLEAETPDTDVDDAGDVAGEKPAEQTATPRPGRGHRASRTTEPPQEG